MYSPGFTGHHTVCHRHVAGLMQMTPPVRSRTVGDCGKTEADSVCFFITGLLSPKSLPDQGRCLLH